DLPERKPVAHLEDQEPRVAAVQEAQPVAPLLDLEEGPGLAVDDHRVPEELRVEDRRDVAREVVAGLVGDERDIEVRHGGGGGSAPPKDAGGRGDTRARA